MKIYKFAVCALAILSVGTLLGGCGKQNGGSVSSAASSGIVASGQDSQSGNTEPNGGDKTEAPEEKFNSEALATAKKFFGESTEESGVAFKDSEKIDGKECYVYAVTKDNAELGRVAVSKENVNDIFVCNATGTFTSYRVDTDGLPESEVKNSNGDRMILNMVDNDLYVYDVDGDTAVLAQIIPIEDADGVEYTNDRISAINFNFDNYTDIAVLKGENPMGLVTNYSDYYLYDESQGRFVKNEQLSKIPNIGVDGGENTLSSYTRSSAYENEEITYSWVDGELVPIGKTTQTYISDEELFYITKYEYDENLKEVEVSRESYTQQELEALQS